MEMGKSCSGLVARVGLASSFSITPARRTRKWGTQCTWTSCPSGSSPIPTSAHHAPPPGWCSPSSSRHTRSSRFDRPFQLCTFRLLCRLPWHWWRCSPFTSNNFFVQAYCGQRIGSDDLIPLIMELTVFPAICLLVLYYGEQILGRHLGIFGTRLLGHLGISE